ncbi:hypothetical protein [Alloalcanivorax xenomutans]|uniref:hypothetical protein n=1 Tax=Alloalcanivorax xenomutans TaxID=1094342 RepID=UPI0003B86256|nr:hypothetical protein [Alloalcanivorax xenomutans]ARB44986.1 hypothetical protein P40_05740 [Alloalcanivorax xenomutans]ERS13528.1 hypothetical protein Q668_13465 [Alcanivorax sp. PN-3]WOA32635.1 hypothetical protein RVY87_06010 [Alloalcanivorax xenomutans]
MRWSRKARILLATLALYSLSAAADDPLRVRVISDQPQQRGAFLLALEQVPSALPWSLVESGADVTLALGAAPFRRAVEEGGPVLGVSVPPAVVDEARRRDCQCSAIWSGVSLEQQLRLIEILFPGVSRVGVLYGPDSAWQPLPSAATASLQLDWMPVSSAAGIGPLLRRYLPQWDLLLLPEDETLFNAGTAKLILLSGYRQRVPVVGPGQGFVNAGSVASVHSSLPALARQTLRWLDQWRQQGHWPSPDFVEHSSISVNEHVARAYNLPLWEPRALQRKWEEQP